MPKEKRVRKPKKAPKHHNMKQKVTVVINNGGKGKRVHTVVKQVPVYISTGPSQSSFAYVPMYPTPAPHLSDEVKKTHLADNIKVHIPVSEHHEVPVANDLMREEHVPSLAAQSVPESLLLQRDASVGSEMGYSKAMSSSSPPPWLQGPKGLAGCAQSPLLRSGSAMSVDTKDPFGDNNSYARLLDTMAAGGIAQIPATRECAHTPKGYLSSQLGTSYLASPSKAETPLKKLEYDVKNDVPMIRNPKTNRLVVKDGRLGKQIVKEYDTKRRVLASLGRLDLILG